MAYLTARDGDRWDVREAVHTARGPRSRTLVSFRPPLTAEVLERAARRARRPLDREALLARAQALGIATSERRDDRTARALLAQLRRGEAIDPALVALLREALGALPETRVPERLADVAEWIGVSDERRGATLRELLRVADRVVRARGERRTRPRAAFPRFDSRARGRRAARAR